MSFLEKVIGFIKTMYIWAKYGFKKSAKDLIDERAEKCQGSKDKYIQEKSCSEWNNKSYFGLGNCKVCGCTRAKWIVPNSECPLKKWKR